MMFTSRLAPYIYGLIEQKQMLGYSFSYGIRVLRWFDSFCVEKYSQEITVTRSMGLEWAIKRSTEKPVSTAKRIAPVRELAKYIQRKGIEAFVIPNEFVKQSTVRHMPHIFTDSELTRFFHETDSITPHIHKECMEPHVMPVLFRLIYSCGLRPQEGRLVKRKDIDLQEGILFIPESKRHKDRLVALPEDTLALCRNYASFMLAKAPENEYFFPSGARTCYTPVSLEHNFQRYWNKAGLQAEACGSKPRIYDFRHTFATKRICQWIGDGRDLDACLPFLSAFMGHAHFSQTAYYFHLVPEVFPSICKLDWESFANCIPEVDEDGI